MLDQEFNLHPSRYYLGLLTLVLLVSALIIVTLPTQAWMGGLLLGAVAIYGFYIYWRYGLLRSRHSILSLRQHSNGRWLLRTQSQECEAELTGGSTVTSWISILRFRVAKQFFPLTCVVLRDSLVEDSYRQLLRCIYNSTQSELKILCTLQKS